MNTILIADDHPVVAEGLQCMLVKQGHIVVAVCTNGLEAYNYILVNRPQIAILDMSMPGMNAIEILEQLSKDKKIPTKVIIYTMVNDIGILNRTKELGVKGFILKEFAMSEIDQCLVHVAAGNEYFSPQLESSMAINNNKDDGAAQAVLTFAEKKILQLVADQKSSKQIAEQLFITEKTVETHRRNIIRKLNIPAGNNALVLWAMKNLK